MNFNSIVRACRVAAIGAILFGSASCVTIDEKLGESLIPTEHKWDVFSPEAVNISDIRLQSADSVSGYNTSRFTFGAIQSETYSTTKSTSFTLIPVRDTMDFGKNTKIRQFHFSAVRDTMSVIDDNDLKIIQNIYVSELKEALDSTVVYMGSFSDYTAEGRANKAKFLQTGERITIGTPVYSGGDSLSFDFSLSYANKVWKQIDAAQKAGQLDSVEHFLKYLPGIHIETDTPAGVGGRINMFKVSLETNSYYMVTGNYAELKFTANYDYSDEPVDTSFIFMFGAGDFIRVEDSRVTYPTQFALNTSEHETYEEFNGEGKVAEAELFVEGGCGVKPVVKADGLKTILEELIAKEGINDPKEVVINKATIIMPYDVKGDYAKLDKYPMILSPTVRLHADGYVTYAGLTDSSISSENQGDINRSTFRYSPDISHHIQEILKLDRNDKDYAKKIENYDIWFLIMHEEISESSSSSSSNDYYNNLLYNSYYNNMMYDPYGYGYGYGGYGGYGYGGYGYGYGGYGYGSNYYNYAMMSYYASAGSSSTEATSSVELDNDRYYYATLNGPTSTGEKPQLKVTFSAPKTAE